MKISKIKKNAREALSGKWIRGVLTVLAYVGIMFIIGLIEGIFEDESIMANLISIVTSIIGVPLSFGFTYSFIRLKRGEDVKTFDFFKSVFSNFGRAWKISLRVVLKLILPIILLVLTILIVVGMLAYFSIELLSAHVANEMLFVVLVGGIVIVVIYCWLIIRALLYSLTTYIAFDNPDMTALEVINESAKMMKGNRMKLILLELSFIGWGILCLFTLGIGYLWLVPYMQVAQVCFYESILEKKDENVDEEPIIEK